MTKLTADERFTFNLGERFQDFFTQDFKINDEIDNWGNVFINFWGSDITESPIEELLYSELLFITDGYDYIHVLDGPEEHYGFRTWISPQHEVGEYRVDFMFGCAGDGKKLYLVVECDGHDFHEKTKEQAANDKARDRFFVKEGYKILRFTGSEIYKDPKKCAEEVEAVLVDMKEEILGIRQGLAHAR